MRQLLLLVLILGLSSTAFADKKAIRPKGSPQAGPYSPGILVDGTLYAAGQLGRDAAGKVPEDFEAEVKLALDNVGAVLKEAGMTYEDVVSVHVFLTDMDLFQRMNAIYMTYFKDPRPARTTVGVTRLAGPSKIEITVIARK